MSIHDRDYYRNRSSESKVPDLKQKSKNKPFVTLFFQVVLAVVTSSAVYFLLKRIFG